MSAAEIGTEPVATPRPHALREVLSNRLVMAGLAVVVVIALAGTLAPLIAPENPNTQFDEGLDADGMPLPPGERFRLGTDSLGRDILSRVLHGARISLTVGMVAVLTATFIGLAVGLLAGYFGRWIDTLLMRFTDIMMTIPALLLAIAFAGLMDGRVVHLHPAGLEAHWLDVRLERGLVSIFLIIGIVSWTRIARVVRGQVLTLHGQLSLKLQTETLRSCDRRWYGRIILATSIASAMLRSFWKFSKIHVSTR